MFISGLVRMRYIESDANLCLRGAALKVAIEDDIKLGLIPFWVSHTQFERISSLVICHFKLYIIFSCKSNLFNRSVG